MFFHEIMELWFGDPTIAPPQKCRDVVADALNDIAQHGGGNFVLGNTLSFQIKAGETVSNSDADLLQHLWLQGMQFAPLWLHPEIKTWEQFTKAFNVVADVSNTRFCDGKNCTQGIPVLDGLFGSEQQSDAHTN